MVFYREALELLRERGSKEDVQRVEAKLREAARRSEDEMKTVEAKIELDFAEWDSIVDTLIAENGDRTVLALSLDDSFTPDKEAARSIAQDTQERFPLQSLVTNVVVDEQQRVNIIDSSEEYMDAATSRQYGLELQVRIVYLERALARLRERGLIGAEILLKHLDESPLFGGQREFLAEGNRVSLSR